MPPAGGDDGTGEGGGRLIPRGVDGTATGAGQDLGAESGSRKRKGVVMSEDSISLDGNGDHLKVACEDSHMILDEIEYLRGELDKDVKELGYCEANQKLRVELALKVKEMQFLRNHNEEIQRKIDGMRMKNEELQTKNDDLVKENEELQSNIDRTSHEDSESEYDPAQDDTGEGDLFDDNTAKDLVDSEKNSKKSGYKRTAAMAPGGIKPRRTKRVLAEQPATRATRSKTSMPFEYLKDLASTDSPVPTPSLPQVVQAEEIVGNHDDHTLPCVQDGVPALPDVNTEMSNENAVIEPDEHNQMGNEEPTSSSQHNEQNEILDGEEEPWNRGLNMGHGLQKLSRARRGKLPLVIPEGRIRPVVPLIAAKFATECNISVRNHVPVLPHWKDYKKQPGIFINFMGKVGIKFDMNASDLAVRKACAKMMKAAIRQQRHRLKKKYFDPYPLHLVTKTSPVNSTSNAQWISLVEHWKNPKRIESCAKNKDNRGQVKFHQTTGSRSYVVHLDNLGDKYKDQEPNALDLFKECHYSKKKNGYTSSVQAAITQMENQISQPAEGTEQPDSVTKVVADFLGENTKINKFLQNVGIQTMQPRSNVQNLEVELAAEKRANVELRSIVDAQREQMDVLSKQVKEGELARIRDQEEMKKKQAETDAKLELVLSQIRAG